MKTQSKRSGFCGTSKVSLDLVPGQLGKVVGGAGAAIDPSGLPKTSLVPPATSES
jgi:hypothetical protein